MTTAAAYFRVSTDEQRERGSIETQRVAVRRFCEQNGIQIVQEYADDGVSGTIPLDKRPEGGRLLHDAGTGKFALVVVYAVDRLGRDDLGLVALSALAVLGEAGIRVQSTTENIDDSPEGRFLAGIKVAVAGLERNKILQRSKEGTERLAHLGAWLGGIVPYGYRTEGEGKDRRLVVNDDPIPGTEVAEADVIRMIFRLAVEEGLSSRRISDHLNALAIPPSYVKDGRAHRKGKRKQATAGIWRPGRIRNLLVSTTYKGIHQYGKRSEKNRQVIEREVPAIVDEDTWNKAQATLRKNFHFSPRNRRRNYLLRGLIKCGICGLTFSGSYSKLVSGKERKYYVCNGRTHYRQIRGPDAEKCPANSLRADEIEDAIWADLEGFLSRPGEILSELGERLTLRSDERTILKGQLASLRREASRKQGERERILTLYRRGTITDSDVELEMVKITTEQRTMESAVREVEERLRVAEERESALEGVGDLLRKLRRRLGQGLDHETKRSVVETLVSRIEVSPDDGGEQEIRVTYRFAPVRQEEQAHSPLDLEKVLR